MGDEHLKSDNERDNMEAHVAMDSLMGKDGEE